MDLLQSIEEIYEFIGNMSFDEFLMDKKTQNAVIRSLEFIGEAAKKIPVEIKDKYSDIPWRYMAGMRDKLIHEYHGVDLSIVWQVIREEIPVIKPVIEKLEKEL